ncbi:hypothetical protein JCM10908_005411 [Rhodotorula pacifica]|uniref:uncharacterized protein n=1 Tax=Rhodotorula pacifica TaxID=1495444 RepID=UPI00316FBF38
MIRTEIRRHWRRVLLALLLLSVLIYGLVEKLRRPPLVIPKRNVPAQVYRHLDLSAPISLRERTRILHVTKEFGPATMGGLGVMLTALATAQAESPLLSIAVALPHYSYLSERIPETALEPFANLSIPVTVRPWYRLRPRTRIYRCPITRLRWPLDTQDPASRGSASNASIDIFLLGPSDDKPFSIAFHAKNEGDIYSAYKPLKQEWKDLYFARAAAELVRYLEVNAPTTSTAGHAPSSESIDVVHLHGATNAIVAHFLRDKTSPPASVAIVYNLHDSLDEVEYSNLVANVRPFLLPASNPAAADPGTIVPLLPLERYVYRSGTQLFTSALGVDLSDVTTFVSKSIAADIVGRRFRFHLEDLVMPAIAAKAAKGDFIGVTNALDFTDPSKNPFLSDQLVQAGLAFQEAYLYDHDPANTEVDEQVPGLPLTSAKRRARRLLVESLPKLFSPEDLHRPWFLFIGRYQYNKGCQFFETLLEVLSSSPISGRLVLLGARNNYPFDELSRLAARYPEHVTLVDDRTPAVSNIQREWGAVLRMASDIAFVPSLSEAFGLVAAEALLFGMPVLSTGVGGLREFLEPIRAAGGTLFDEQDDSPAAQTGNSYLFDLFPDRDTAATQGAEQDYSQSAEDVRPSDALLAPARDALRGQAAKALRDWAWRQEASHRVDAERFHRVLIMQALSLRWDRPGGPVEEYLRVYDRAIERHALKYQ